MQIHESSEDYLESILMLKERKGFVRSIDIANELDYTKASVSIAMKKLRKTAISKWMLKVLSPSHPRATKLQPAFTAATSC